MLTKYYSITLVQLDIQAHGSPYTKDGSVTNSTSIVRLNLEVCISVLHKVSMPLEYELQSFSATKVLKPRFFEPSNL